MEATGTAIATVASQIGAFIASFIFMYRRREEIGLVMCLSYFRFDRDDLKIIMKLGIPQMIRILSVQGSMIWVKANINDYGLSTSATYSVGNKIEKFMNIFINGMDGAGGAMIGQNLGARKHNREKEVIHKSLICSLSIGLLAAVIFLVFPEQLYAFFTKDQEVITYGRVFLRIMAVGCLVRSFAGPAKSIVTGAGEALLSLVIGVMDGVSRVLVCLFFSFVLQQGAQSFFWGAALCQVIQGIISFVYYLSGRWQRKKLLFE